MSSSAEVHTPPQSAATAAPELVKGLGLTSATTLVMGSMIGSGIFIVSAEIARETNSPALLVAAWLVTGFLTLVGGLSLWMDAVSGDPDRHNCRCGRGLRQISGLLFPKRGVC